MIRRGGAVGRNRFDRIVRESESAPPVGVKQQFESPPLLDGEFPIHRPTDERLETIEHGGRRRDDRGRWWSTEPPADHHRDRHQDPDHRDHEEQPSVTADDARRRCFGEKDVARRIGREVRDDLDRQRGHAIDRTTVVEDDRFPEIEDPGVHADVFQLGDRPSIVGTIPTRDADEDRGVEIEVRPPPHVTMLALDHDPTGDAPGRGFAVRGR